MSMIIGCAFSDLDSLVWRLIFDSSGLICPLNSDNYPLSNAQFFDEQSTKGDSYFGGVKVDIKCQSNFENIIPTFLADWSPSDTVGWFDSNLISALGYFRDIVPDVRYVLIYSKPSVAVLSGAKEGFLGKGAIDERLKSWIEYNEKLASFYFRNRDCCVLFNSAHLLNNPESIANLLSRQFSPKNENELKDALDFGLYEYAIAELAFGNRAIINRKAEHLYQELESVSDGCCPNLDMHIGRVLQDMLVYGKKNTFAMSQPGSNEIGSPADRAASNLLIEKNTLLLMQYYGLMDEINNLTIGLLTERDKCLELLDQRDRLAAQLDMSEQNIAQLKFQLENCEIKAREKQVESELFLMQAIYLQEEFERTYRGNKIETPCLTSSPTMLPKEVVYDLRSSNINGSNWYYPEHDGRWAGPGMRSMLSFPTLGSGEYRLKLVVVDAMENDIFCNTTIAINGIEIDATKDPGYKYPRSIECCFEIDQFSKNIQVELIFPKVISPDEKGSDDHRRLALRVLSVELQLTSNPFPKKRARSLGAGIKAIFGSSKQVSYGK